MPKYSRLERERRFLIAPESIPLRRVKPPSKLLEDRYLACGRLRLRKLTDSDCTTPKYKLTKKYESETLNAGPITTLFLSENEYRALLVLDGFELRKRRHYDEHAGHIFSIDVFEGELAGLVLAEVELEETETKVLALPDYLGPEVTSAEFFTGAKLSRARSEDLARELGVLRR